MERGQPVCWPSTRPADKTQSAGGADGLLSERVEIEFFHKSASKQSINHTDINLYLSLFVSVSVSLSLSLAFSLVTCKSVCVDIETAWPLF